MCLRLFDILPREYVRISNWIYILDIYFKNKLFLKRHHTLTCEDFPTNLTRITLYLYTTVDS